MHDEGRIKPHLNKRLLRKGQDFFVGHALHLTRQNCQILEHVSGDQRIALEDDRPVDADTVQLRFVQSGHIPQRGDPRAVRVRFMIRHQDPPGVGWVVRHDQLQEHGLAAPRTTHNGHQFPTANGQIDARQDHLAAKGLGEVLKDDFWGLGGGHGRRGYL